MGFLVVVFSLIPKNLLSFFIGWLSRIEWPYPFSLWLCKLFVFTFGINMSEAEKPLAEYRSIEEVFTRKLKPNSRKIAPTFASPSDGFFVRSMPASNDTAIQAKELDFSLKELVFGEAPSQASLSWFLTIYLAPPNYHRVHTPVEGKLLGFRYFPGELWPVNKIFAGNLPQLFTRNERVVFDIELPQGGMLYLAMVGALNVGRISVSAFPDFVSNSLKRQLGAGAFSHKFDKPIYIERGDELGVFMLGSTVVIAMDDAASHSLSPVQSDENRPILLGESLTKSH